MHFPHKPTWTYNSNHFGNGLGCDGMISSHHDDLYPSCATFSHSLQHIGARRVYQSSKANETKAFQRKINIVRVKFIIFWKVIRIEFRMSKSE